MSRQYVVSFTDKNSGKHQFSFKDQESGKGKQYTQQSIFSEVSVNSSRFQDEKKMRKQSENQVISKIIQVRANLEKKREMASQCLKFRPIKKSTKQN